MGLQHIDPNDAEEQLREQGRRAAPAADAGETRRHQRQHSGTRHPDHRQRDAAALLVGPPSGGIDAGEHRRREHHGRLHRLHHGGRAERGRTMPHPPGTSSPSLR